MHLHGLKGLSQKLILAEKKLCPAGSCGPLELSPECDCKESSTGLLLVSGIA